MELRSRFNFESFVSGWPEFRNLPPVTSQLDEVPPARRIGLATLDLLSVRLEYWVALGAIATSADEEGLSIPDLLAVHSPAGEFAYTSAEQMAAWAVAQPVAGVVEREPMTSAIWTVGSTFRPEAVALAAETGGSFTICRETYEPDWDRVWECVRRGLDR
jgi:hypothetical protein